jgi:hypothetical protein
MANLMQLGNEFENILELIKINEGEITQEIEEQLAIAEKAIVGKVDNIGYYIREKEKKIETLKEFELSAKNHRSVIESDLKGFKVWLARAVRAFGSAEGYASQVLAGNVVKIKDISKEITVIDDNLIEDKFRKVVVTMEMSIEEFTNIHAKRGVLRTFLNTHSAKGVEMLDSTKINAAIDQGEQVRGVGKETKFNTQLLGLKKLDTIKIEASNE